jgi:hypothetical protein
VIRKKKIKMRRKMEKKIHRISYAGEIIYTMKLISKIVHSGFVDANTVLINCQPEFSSILCQRVNHKLSYLNDNKLLEQYPLEIPLKGVKQVWNELTGEYEPFELYLSNWVRKLDKSRKYLFLTNIVHSSAYNKLMSLLKASFEEGGYRLGCLFVSTESGLNPDFYVEEVDGRVLFEWENMDCKDRIF